jgi:predicted NUDIX family NTP pyrophosphohydrolase
LIPINIEAFGAAFNILQWRPCRPNELGYLRVTLMAATSAGILLYRRNGDLEVLLVHPGGPYWRTRDDGAWSIPKGELDGEENMEVAARREFAEELGIEVTGPLQSLGQIRQRAGKIVWGYALEGDLGVSSVRCNEVSMEWPPRSGRTINFPEIDRAAWFDLTVARQKILAAQRPFLDRLETLCRRGSGIP